MSKGFTILEIVVVVAIVSVLALEIGFLFITAFSGSNQQFSALENIDNARIVSSRFINEIRSAVPGVDGSSAIILAGDTEIIFYSSRVGPGTSVKRVRYFVSDNILHKGVVVSGGNPLFYDLESEKVTLVQRDLSLGGNPLFYYYDGDYDGETGALVQPVNINDIRFVRINLEVLKQTIRGSEDTFSVSIGATVRSLKDNLGD